MNRRRLGAAAETMACRFLESQGFTVLQRNFRTRRGEIDIVAREGDTLVFVEVKYRQGAHCGLPEEAVPPGKQRQILGVARAFLREADWPCRFDVVAMDATPAGPRFRLYRDAFRADA
jgi:putative endonuclease